MTVIELYVPISFFPVCPRAYIVQSICLQFSRSCISLGRNLIFGIDRDRIAALIRQKLGGASDVSLTLAQILESATWKGGREIARQRRPETGGPPIEIESDGTVF